MPSSTSSPLAGMAPSRLSVVSGWESIWGRARCLAAACDTVCHLLRCFGQLNVIVHRSLYRSCPGDCERQRRRCGMGAWTLGIETVPLVQYRFFARHCFVIIFLVCWHYFVAVRGIIILEGRAAFFVVELETVDR